jgi:predicted DNA binding CopG/RHH family protein
MSAGSPEPDPGETLIGIDAAPQDEDVPRKDRLGELRRINKKVVEVTEAAAEATAQALEAAEAAKQARKRKRAEATKQARKRKRDAAVQLARTAASEALKAVRPDQDLDLATELNLPPQQEVSPPVRERRQNVVSLRLDNAEFERIKQFAGTAGLPVATSVRALLMQALDRNDEDQAR